MKNANNAITLGFYFHIYIFLSKTCINMATSCLSCSSSDHRILSNTSSCSPYYTCGSCLCKPTFYDNGDVTCDSCHYSWFILLFYY